MKLALALILVTGTAYADSSSLALTLPNPPMNYQSDTFSSGNLRCSNAVGGATSLEFGVMGNINNVGGSFGINSQGQSKDIGVYTRIVIPLDKPRSRINCDDLYKVELTQRKLEIQQLRNELEALKDLQKAAWSSRTKMDTTKIADNIDGLADRQIKAGGIKLTPASVFAIITFLSTVVGGLYGGFVMYQKIEEVAGLDLGEYQQAMDVMDAKVTGISTKVEESVEYTRDIKNGLRDDILGIEKQADRVEDTVRSIEDTVDTLLRDHEAKIRTLIDAADVRFESQRDRLRTSQDAEMKELEARLTKKLQRALDNPLAN